MLLLTGGFDWQLDGRIRGKVETELIEPYKGLNDYSASSLAANVIMYRVSIINVGLYVYFLLHE